MQKNKDKESSYYRFIILIDSNLNTMILIIKNDDYAKYIFDFCNKFSIGSMVVISKPKLEGYYNKTMIISTNYIYIAILKDIPLQVIANNERYYCYHFTTSKHYIENIFTTEKLVQDLVMVII